MPKFIPIKDRLDTNILSMIQQDTEDPKVYNYLTAYAKEDNDVTIVYDTTNTLSEEQKEFLIHCWHENLGDGISRHYMKYMKGVEK